MSSTNVAALKSSLQDRLGKRRFKDFQWLDLGSVVLQSPTAAEWIKIDSARARAQLAAMGGRTKEHEQAAREFTLQTCCLLVLGADHNPFFSAADEALIVGQEGYVIDALVNAAIQHAEPREISLGAAQKKSQETSGSSEPTGFGST